MGLPFSGATDAESCTGTARTGNALLNGYSPGLNPDAFQPSLGF